MPVTDLCNPAIIKFFTENYEKTTRLRMKWNETHKEKLYAAATLTENEKGYIERDVLRESMACGMATITRDNKVAARNRRLTAIRDATYIPGIAAMRKEHSIVEVGLGSVKEDPRLGRPDTDLSFDPKMRVMDPKQRKIIYKDIPEFGRKAYLKSRFKMAPEDKFYFRESSAWECGWRLKDSFFKNQAPQFGKVWRLTRDTQSLTGPQPNPYYYKDSDIPGPSKCLI